MQAILGLFVVFLVKYAYLEEIGSPLRMAQCRATCVHKFSPPGFGHKERCSRGSQCGICWSSCRHHSNSLSNCTQSSVCGPGCEAACKFMESGRGSQRAPVLVRRGEEVLKIDGQNTKWPAPAPELEGPWVYLVMRRLNNAWRQITQTLDLSAKIPQGGMVRVLVVGKDGLVTIYGPAEEIGLGEDKGWHLREVSVIHQEAVVIAEVAWEARRPRALYLVTWEVAGGGLRGNLLTSSTCVALSLWPDTLFHVQVELMAPELDELRTTQRKSKELIIDTRRSAEMEVLMDSKDEDEEVTEDEKGKGGGIEPEVEEEEEEEKETVNTSSDSLYAVSIKTSGGENEAGVDLELMAGAVCALFLFLLLLLCLFWLRRRFSFLDKNLQLNTPVQGSFPTVSLVMVSNHSPNDLQSISHEAVT
ncbi:uncharacterized protein LOC142331334 [Lycorma delicatula]|uniref:uncharacterized protein LOC142331334 n=1 Tax=Lycorma delicatula TaxID=130591 RepID=UPI003F51A299